MIQKTLSDFYVYEELRRLYYIDNHKDAILRLLWPLKEVSGDLIAQAGGKQYNARILELRRDGWQIIAIRRGRVSFNFQLLSRERREF